MNIDNTDQQGPAQEDYSDFTSTLLHGIGEQEEKYVCLFGRDSVFVAFVAEDGRMAGNYQLQAFTHIDQLSGHQDAWELMEADVVTLSEALDKDFSVLEDMHFGFLLGDHYDNVMGKFTGGEISFNDLFPLLSDGYKRTPRPYPSRPEDNTTFLLTKDVSIDVLKEEGGSFSWTKEHVGCAGDMVMMKNNYLAFNRLSLNGEDSKGWSLRLDDGEFSPLPRMPMDTWATWSTENSKKPNDNLKAQDSARAPAPKGP